MPIINPSSDINPVIEHTLTRITQAEHDRITAYLNVSNKKCHVCESVVFGRCTTCPYCFGRNNVVTLLE